jgi:hypothetical protein
LDVTTDANGREVLKVKCFRYTIINDFNEEQVQTFDLDTLTVPQWTLLFLNLGLEAAPVNAAKHEQPILFAKHLIAKEKKAENKERVEYFRNRRSGFICRFINFILHPKVRSYYFAMNGPSAGNKLQVTPKQFFAGCYEALEYSPEPDEVEDDNDEGVDEHIDPMNDPITLRLPVMTRVCWSFRTKHWKDIEKWYLPSDKESVEYSHIQRDFVNGSLNLQAFLLPPPNAKEFKAIHEALLKARKGIKAKLASAKNNEPDPYKLVQSVLKESWNIQSPEAYYFYVRTLEYDQEMDKAFT